jgi:hypothetical protein
MKPITHPHQVQTEVNNAFHFPIRLLGMVLKINHRDNFTFLTFEVVTAVKP